MQHSKFQSIGPVVLDKKIFQGFYHTWAWWPSWSCDLDQIHKLSAKKFSNKDIDIIKFVRRFQNFIGDILT